MYRYKYSIVFVFLVLFRFGFAQNPEFPVISKQNLESHVRFLASDSLQGRGFSGSFCSIEIAADYLKEMVNLAGLQNKGNGFSQNFAVIKTERDEKNTWLKIISNRKEKKVGPEKFAVINQNSDIIEIEGEPLFLGFGLPDGENESDWFPDVQDKVVLVSAGTSESFADGSFHFWDNNLERSKTENIFNAGARAVLLITSLHDRDNKTFAQIVRRSNSPRFSLENNSEKQNQQLVIAAPEVADAILGRNGSWKKLVRQAANNKPPASFSAENRILLKSVRKTEIIKGQNIIGIVEGSDPILKEECVVFMAHYDHLGMNSHGEIYNGADDNASGTSVLLEVSRAFARTDKKPKRSIVFLWVTAEEVGLLGSEYYSKNPVFPLKKTVACINLDMVGRVYEPRDSVWAHSSKQVKPFDEIYTLVNDFDPELKNITESACSALNLTPDFNLPGNFFYSSDHYHFHRNKVPVLNLSTGYTADYHQPTDNVDRINFEKVKKVAELCFLVGTAIANK